MRNLPASTQPPPTPGLATQAQHVIHDKKGGEEQARRDAEEQARRDAEEQARRDAEVQVQPEPQRKARLPTRRSVTILLASLSVGIVVVLAFYLRSSTNPLTSQIPRELRSSCTHDSKTSAICQLDADTSAKYDLFDTADHARAYVQAGVAPNGDPCPLTTPPSGIPSAACKYTSGTQRGVAKFSYINNHGSPFYSATWNPDGKRVTGFIYSMNANAQDWESLRNNWARLASMG
jgi:hypothetical protein